MTCNLNLQRNSKVFFSSIDIDSGAAVTAMTPANTWQIEVLAGYATSQAATTQDITTLESGLSPDRSTSRFNTAIEPVNWNFTTYVRPTGLESPTGDGVSSTSNVKPVADWFLWQALLSNANAASQTAETSAWQAGGSFATATRAAAANTVAHSPNFAFANEMHLYFRMDNVIYQVKSAAVEEATLDAAIETIATTKWTGFGRNLVELTGTKRDNAVAVFGGNLNNGFAVTGNANVLSITKATQYHTWGSYNVAGTVATASFIKERLSTIDMFHAPSGSAAVNYTFPVTALSWTWKNNITYLTPEELSALNTPIGNFSGARTISGSITAYLRHGTGSSSQFLRNIVTDTVTSSSGSANANVKVGGATAPYLALYMPAVQFNFPVHNIEDVITITGDYLAQEPSTSCGQGGEVTIFAKK